MAPYNVASTIRQALGSGVTCGDVDECAAANGGCDRLTVCTNTVGARACGGCPAGYKGSGETGCKEESACASNNGGCDALTACVDTGTGAGAGSACGPCPAGFTGNGTSGCVDFDACAAEPCAAGVHCEDSTAPLMTGTCGKAAVTRAYTRPFLYSTEPFFCL
jgi:hypothetical protein